LGLTSIQAISHRLENYFNIFQDSSFEPDQKLAAYFLSLFITLQELIEKLSAQGGLTPEFAQNSLAKVEPVFKQLETHLNNLITVPEATVEEDGETSPMTSSQQKKPPTVDQSFHKQVLLRLKEMLSLYKQPDSSENRCKWQEYCHGLADLGRERNLAPWVLLLEATEAAIANPENAYRSCAGVVIKEIKGAREKIVAGKTQEIAISQQLQALLPEPKTHNRAPEVGMAAINSLADLFEEEEAPDLENTWQVEEVIEKETSEAEFSSQDTFFEEEENEQERDFDELFLDMDEEDEISSAENLVNLFEEDFEQEEETTSSSSTLANGKVDPSERLDEVADLLSSSGFASDSDTEDFSWETESLTENEEAVAPSFAEREEEEDSGDDLNALFADTEEESILGEKDLPTVGTVEEESDLATAFGDLEEELDLDFAFTDENENQDEEEETQAFNDLDTLFEPDESETQTSNSNEETSNQEESEESDALGFEGTAAFDDLLVIGSDSSEETAEALESFDDLLAIGADDPQELADDQSDDIPTGELGFGELLDSESTQAIKADADAEIDLPKSAIESLDLDAFADSQEGSDFTELNDLFEEEIARESSELDNTFSEPTENNHFSFDLDTPEQDLAVEELADLPSTFPEAVEEDFTADTLDLSNQSSPFNGASEDNFDFDFDTNSSLEDVSLELADSEENGQEDLSLDLDTSLENVEDDDLSLDFSFLEGDSPHSNLEVAEEEVSLDDLDALLDDSQSLEIDTEAEEAQSLESLFDWDAEDSVTEPAETSSQPAKEETLEYYTSFQELEALIKEDSTAKVLAELNGIGAFEQLENLLQNSVGADSPQEQNIQLSSSANPSQVDSNSLEDEFSDLEDLLKDIESQVGGTPSVVPRSGQQRPTSGNSQKKVSIFEQTLKVPVKQLDNLINLMGELVVNRNGLEKDQEMLRQSLDSLLQQAGNLSDVGSRMQDLYERSLLESSLLASRQRHNRATVGIDIGPSRNGGSGDQSYDPLEMDRFSGFHLLSQEMIELVVRVRESASDIGLIVEEVDQVARNLRHVTGQMQEGLTKARMVPFDRTASRLPIAVKRVSQELNKQAQIQLEGRETLIDKMILEHLSDPLTHLVNNALYHGIEPAEVRLKAGKTPAGKITVSAFHQGNQTIITVADDGGGIPVDVVKRKAVDKGLISSVEAQQISDQEVYGLLFQPGFSTNDQADNFAGRGVGMDVVRNSIMEIRGTVAIDSDLGKGTTFTIRLPLNLSISPALCCRVENTSIAFPMDGVEDVIDVSASQIQTNAQGETCIHWRDNLLPFKPITELLSYNRRLGRRKMYRGKRQDELNSILVLRSAGNFIAVEVDQVLEEQEIVIKQLTGPVPKPLGIAGATVLGDGRVMPIADVLELMDLFHGRSNSGGTWQENNVPAKSTPEISQSEPMVLIVDDSITVRELLSITFNKAGYRVEQARDGQEAWEKLRSGLPCNIVFCDIEMPRMNGLELLGRLQKDEQLKNLPIAMLTSRGAARHKEAAAELGANGYFTKPYLEENLLDGAQRMMQGEVLLEGSTRVSRVHEPQALAKALKTPTQPIIQPETPAPVETISQQEPLVLIIDDSIVVRELLSETFIKAGYSVEQARDGQEAWEKLQDGLMCDLAFCDIEMPRMNGLDLLTKLQQDEELSKLPVAMLTSRGAQKHRQIAAERGAKAYFTKPYVEATLLNAAKKLLAGEILTESSTEA
ncbi:MAG: response regulator, partial [Spirulinaceae cyanobacterium]